MILQRSLNNTTWVSITLPGNKTNAAGAYQLTTKELTAGTYYYRTSYAGTSTYAANTSKGVKVVVSSLRPYEVPGSATYAPSTAVTYATVVVTAS